MGYRNASFIRWAGGKSWLMPYIKELLADLEMTRYFEPFMGGASIFFLLQPECECYLSDVNGDLVDTFNAVKTMPETVEKYLREFKNTEEEYYRIRKTEYTDPAKQAARFLYLNYTSFNGLYRVNKEGKYNVPYGFRKVSFDYEKMHSASKALQNAVIKKRDFADIENDIQAGDLVFLDPPYTTSSKNSENGFRQYNQKLFSLDDQKRLAKLANVIHKRKGYYIVTNACNEEIKSIFDTGENQIIEVTRTSLMSGKKKGRGEIQELIFTNIPKGDDSHGR